jgi:hypothetical protein
MTTYPQTHTAKRQRVLYRHRTNRSQTSGGLK